MSKNNYRGKKDDRNYKNGKGKNGRSSYSKKGKDAPKNDKEYTSVTKDFRDYDALKSNDVSWYNKNPVQYALATKVPTFAQIQGAEYASGLTLPLYDTEYGHYFDLTEQVTSVMPGIMAINFAPTIGISTENTSPVNKAFTRLMSELYARTSGSSLNFQQADLAMMIISLSSLSSLFAHTKRVLSTRSFWITRNINYPRTLCRALGVGDYDDMIQYYNSYVVRLNDLIAQFNAIKIPSWFDIFARHYSLAKNVYLDEDSEFGQIFVFKPEIIWKYSDEFGRCQAVTVPNGDNVKVSQLLDLIEECLNVWLNSSDLYTINGALLRAFGSDSNFIFIEPFESGTLINPLVDDYMGMQLQNCSIIGDCVHLEEWRITQEPDTNTVIFDPSTESYTISDYRQKAVLARAFKDVPTPDDNMEMTRLTAVVKAEGSQLKLDTCGTEIITSIRVYSTKGAGVPIYNNIIDFADTTGRAQLWDLLTKLRDVTVFRYKPRLVLVSDSESGVYGDLLEIGDQYNYCVLPVEDLRQLHTTALYSIWKPEMK